MRVGAWLVEEQNMGCGTSRPREMQVIHSPYPWYGGRVAPVLEPDGKVILISKLLAQSLQHWAPWKVGGADILLFFISQMQKHLSVPHQTTATAGGSVINWT